MVYKKALKYKPYILLTQDTNTTYKVNNTWFDYLFNIKVIMNSKLGLPKKGVHDMQFMENTTIVSFFIT